MLLCEDISGGQPADRQCETGQYRFAVASGESRGSSSCQHLETHPTLPRIGTDRSRNLLVWLRIRPRYENSALSFLTKLQLGAAVPTWNGQPVETVDVWNRYPITPSWSLGRMRNLSIGLIP